MSPPLPVRLLLCHLLAIACNDCYGSQIGFEPDSSGSSMESDGKIILAQNPWNNPIPNIDAAMVGFDPVKSDPYIRPDPGMRSKIFVPMRDIDYFGKPVVNSFIGVAQEGIYCDTEFSSTIVRNTNQFNDQKTSSYSYSKSGGASVNAFFRWFGIGASFEMRSSEKGTESSVTNFFKETSGEIVESEASCITHNIEISSVEKPVFTHSFISGLRLLNAAATSAQPDNDTYIEFVEEFGTHFLKNTKLGSKMIFIKSFSSKSEDAGKQNARRQCVSNAAKGSMNANFGKTFSGKVSFSSASNECEGQKTGSSNSDENESKISMTILDGSLPTTSFDEWAKNAKDSPVPVSFELETISTLFREEFLGDIPVSDDVEETRKLNASAIREYFDAKCDIYCQIYFGTDCAERTGCGYTDDCPARTRCVPDYSSSLGYRCLGHQGGVVMAGGYRPNGYTDSVEVMSTFSLPNLPIKTYGNTLTAVGSVLYSCGGDGQYGERCYTLDVSSPAPEWQHTITLPTSMYFHTAVNVDSHIWLSYRNTIYDIDTISSRVMIYKPPFQSDAYHCAVSNASHSFVLGVGADNNQIWVNTVPNSPSAWKKVTELAKGRSEFGCLWFDSSIFITGGYGYVDIVDINSLKIDAVSHLNTGRQGHKMFLLDGKPAVAGGRNGNNYIASIETYDILTGLWKTDVRELSFSRGYFGLAQLN